MALPAVLDPESCLRSCYGRNWMTPSHDDPSDTLALAARHSAVVPGHAALSDNWQQYILLFASFALLLGAVAFQAAKKRSAWNTVFMVLYIGLGVAEYIMTRWISLRHNGLPFVAISGVLLIEVCKLLFTSGLLLVTGGFCGFGGVSGHDILLLGIPAAMYAGLNVFFYIGISSSSIANYAITLEMQVVFVAICWVIAFRRWLNLTRAVACAGIVAGCYVQHRAQWLSQPGATAAWLPAAVALWGAITSVTCEVVFKRGKGIDINIQNFVLYGYGVAIGTLVVLFLSWKSSKSIGGLFVGTYKAEVIALLSIRALQGLAASRVLKYIDSMSKTIGSALTGPLAMAIAPLFMQEPLTTQTLLAIFITYVSSFAFWAQPNATASESAAGNSHKQGNPSDHC